jgi:hypothetical protein
MLYSDGQIGRIVSKIIVCSLILLFSLAAITSFLQESPTFDETVHLFSGYSYVRWGDFRANPEHPPLAKVLAALPLLALTVKDPRRPGADGDLVVRERMSSWNVANQMVFFDNDAETLFLYAKLPMIALGIILGLFVCRWAKEIFGWEAAIASLFIYCLDPNILAHSRLVHTDIPFSAFFFMSTYFFWRTLTQLTWLNLLLTSFFFGLSAITKYSFLGILPIWTILGFLRVLSSEPQQSRITLPHLVSSRAGKAVLLAIVLGSAVITAYLFIWAAYGFLSSPVLDGRELHFPIGMVVPDQLFVQALITFVTNHQILPETWIYGFLYALKSLKRSTYLLGQISDTGFWLYFPVAFAVKTPLPTLLIVLGTVGVWIFKRKIHKPEIFLLIPVVGYFFLAVWSQMNIGLRHILPIYPFLFVLAGGTAAELWRIGGHVKRAGLVLLALWYSWSFVSIYPHYLAYFNELVGGPKSGHKILVDSNLDWGQDLKGLKRWMDENNIKKIQLAYFGTADQLYYGIDAVYLPGTWIPSPRLQNKDTEIPKYVAISATHLYGVYLAKPLRDLYKPFRLKQPTANIGHSIFVYKLD